MTSLQRARLVNLLLLVSAGLSVVVVVLSANLPGSVEQAVRRRHLLPVFRLEDVRRLELRHGAVRTVAERRSEPEGAKGAEGTAESGRGQWLLVEPFETDVDMAPLERLLGTLRYATWLREADAPMAPAPGHADAGPRAPALGRRELGVRMGSRDYRLRLGGESVQPEGSRYVEVESDAGKHTYVVEKRLVDELFIDGQALRGRQIVPYRKSSIARLVLSSAAGVRRFRRAPLGFRFDGMHDDRRTSRAALDRVFLSLVRSSADPFVEPEVARAALSVDSTVRVAISPTDPTRREASLEFGGKCPGDPDKTLALRHLPEPMAGCVDRGVLFALREPAETFEDAGLFALESDEVERVLIAEGERRLEMVRQGEGFVLRQPRAVSVDSAAARDRLERIVGLQGELLEGRVKPLHPEAFSHIVVTLESSSVPSADLGSAEAESRGPLGTAPEPVITETLRLSKPRKDGAVWAYRQSDEAVLLVSADDALALWPDATLLKDPQVFEYDLSDVREVAITGDDIAQTLVRSEAGGVSLSRPKGYDVDGTLALELLDQLRALRAVRWVSDRDSDGFGLGKKPHARVELTVQQGDREVTRTLKVGRRAPGGHYASVDRDPGVFVMPRPTERAIFTWLLSRGGFSSRREAITEITLLAPGRGRVIVRRVAGELGVQRGSQNFDSARLDELLSALEGLRPEAALHLGPPGRGEGFRRPVLTIVIRARSAHRQGLSTLRVSVGSRDSVRGSSVHYARSGSVNATYALPSHQVRRLLELF